jgi:hypothetical protein
MTLTWLELTPMQQAVERAKARRDEMLLIHYVCPRCGEDWEETWECACDSECGKCGLKNIEALSWETAPAEA